MASIGQIITYMNERKIKWYPQLIVEVELRDDFNSSYPMGYVIGEEDDLYIRYDCQKHIGHYFEWKGEGNGCGIILFPLNTGKYLKALFEK